MRMYMAPPSASPPKCSGAFTTTGALAQSALASRPNLRLVPWSTAGKGPTLRNSRSCSLAQTAMKTSRNRSFRGYGMSVTLSSSISALTPCEMSEPTVAGDFERFFLPPCRLEDLGGPWDKRAPEPMGLRESGNGAPPSSATLSSTPQFAGLPSLSLRAYGQTCEDRGSCRWIWQRPISPWPKKPPTCSTSTKISCVVARMCMVPWLWWMLKVSMSAPAACELSMRGDRPIS
mmetsp:Transcript_132966/g.384462  ORF Transcript_132966/g.384462 Transcript_132966/m.384462 type:complete len:232 (-) Transcript_132966:477-1172(-)